jgi:transcriptional repressor NrdR
LLASQKRPIPVGELEAIVEDIEGELYKLGQAEVESRVIGELVMERLRKLDDIAYIRFASVYRSYPDIQAMRQELDRLIEHEHDSEHAPNGQPPAAASAGTASAGAGRHPT